MLKIAGGRVYDPQNGVWGEIKDLFIEDGKIVSPREGGREEAVEVLDAAGKVVLPAGVEIHTHVAGPKVNTARMLCPEDHYGRVWSSRDFCRSGSGYTTPTTFLTGYLYALQGYTTVFEAAAAPLMARHVHEELNDMPLVDIGFYTLMGNNYLVMKALAEKDPKEKREKLVQVVSWLLKKSGGYAVKVVNPGGVEAWKWGSQRIDFDGQVAPFGVTPRDIVTGLAEAVQALGLPHPLHLHANDLGRPGNWETTVRTMRALSGYRVHFTHLQFHAYRATKKGGFASAAAELAEVLNREKGFTCDVGQLVFGPATTMTADAPVEFGLFRLTGNKWANHDVELESGSGVVPMLYRPQNLVNAVQWATGLELFLLIEDPWKVFLTTDHPNGGPFTSYPEIIRLLMDSSYREEKMATLHPRLQKYTHLKEIRREYSLGEIAVITSAGPAKALGLKHKGHLGPGADADLVVLESCDDIEAMFRNPAYVLKAGKVIVKDGRIVGEAPTRRYTVRPCGEDRLPGGYREYFEQYYTVSVDNYGVEPCYLRDEVTIPCT